MLESLVAWVLNNYFGKYIENLNTDQLSIALLRGSVELENLPLKKDALRHLGLPVEIKSGLIGKVKLTVPVTQIRSAPWVISVYDLVVEIRPIDLKEWDAETEELAEHEYKLALLDSMEACWRSTCSYNNKNESSYYASSYYSWFTYGSGLVNNIVENIQLEVKNVSIQYEDVMINRGFVAGISVDSLSVQSCDANWKPGFTYWDATDGKHSYQLLKLMGLSIFWDTNCDSIKAEHCYILPSVNAEAHVKRNRSAVPLKSKKEPRIICDLCMQTVQFFLSDKQYEQIVHCARGLANLQKARKYAAFRPQQRVLDNKKAWWEYAAKCNMYRDRKDKRRVSWEDCSRMARENVTYVKLYSAILSSPATCLSPEDKELKQNVEWDRRYEELRALREVAMLKADLDKKLLADNRYALFQWFPQWWSSSSEEFKATNMFEEEFMTAIADTLENNTIFRRDALFGQFNFVLTEGTCTLLVEGTGKAAVTSGFENLKLELESRPRTNSSKIVVSLGGVVLKDNLTPDTIFPVVVSPQNRPDAPSAITTGRLPPSVAAFLPQPPMRMECLFKVLYEWKPQDGDADGRLHVESKSLDIVWNVGVAKWLMEFFTKPFVERSERELRKAAKERYDAVKRRTREEFLKKWDDIVQGNMGGKENRKKWDVRLDLSAPQFFLVERFDDKYGLVCIVDFGKLFFVNHYQPGVEETVTKVDEKGKEEISEDDEEEEEFATPCSTPPGSETSGMDKKEEEEEDTKTTAESLNETSLHNMIYDSYKMDLSDLQILLGRLKDNWKFGSLKGTSSIQVLDKFNISLQIERRVVHTNDPRYPDLMILGNLPKLVVHANEYKIQALRSVYDVIMDYGATSPFKGGAEPEEEPLAKEYEEWDLEFDSEEGGDSKLFVLQFVVNNLSLEVQSRGRSIAELQVSGIKTSFTKKPADTSLSLSVHSLLLVDALQTFGPDFELLLASHKHVGMDSLSGSLKDSDPTSPNSPGSPDVMSKAVNTSPFSLFQALSTLNGGSSSREEFSFASVNASSTLPPSPMEAASMMSNVPAFLDSEALIRVDIELVKGNRKRDGEHLEDVQIASIQFNNLDIVANQETIVELISFGKRVLSQFQRRTWSDHRLDIMDSPMTPLNRKLFPGEMEEGFDFRAGGEKGEAYANTAATKTELIFDFRRLNILLLRAVTLENGVSIARKIATTTMTDAKIHATVGEELFVEGSLGGLQILNLTQEGRIHQRILSFGQDPLKAERYLLASEKRPSALFEHLSADIYNVGAKACRVEEENADNLRAFHFTARRNLYECREKKKCTADVKVRFSSALYTHAPQFISELSCYAAEFKQYLKNLAKSIGSAATEMAFGLVHARAEAIVHSLSVSSRLGFYGSASDIPGTPGRYRSPSVDQDGCCTPYWTQGDCCNNYYDTDNIEIKLDMVIDSPIIVLPRYAQSYQVFVAHLGRISVMRNKNHGEEDEFDGEIEKYQVEVRDMNLYSLDTKKKLAPWASEEESRLSVDLGCLSQKAEDVYDCEEDGKPVLHDTALELNVVKDLTKGNNFSDDKFYNFNVTGIIITPLKVSLSRDQYEQLIETANTILTSESDGSTSMLSDHFSGLEGIGYLPDIAEEAELRSGVSALDLDPALRAKMLSRHSSSNLVKYSQVDMAPFIAVKVSFEIPVITIELMADFGNGEQGLVDVSFRDFGLEYERLNSYETYIWICLKSLLMEDLQREPNSKHRYMLTSSTASKSELSPSNNYKSTSCPDLAASNEFEFSIKRRRRPLIRDEIHSSLPDYLETESIISGCSRIRRESRIQRQYDEEEYPCTPPPSPKGRKLSTRHREDNLVRISVVLYSKNSTKFRNKKVYRTVKADFNTLDVIVNKQSWVVVLDFFGLGTEEKNEKVDEEDGERREFGVDFRRKGVSGVDSLKQHPMAGTGQLGFIPVQECDLYCYQRSELDVTIKSLSLVLNRRDYEAARANISGLSAHIIRNTMDPSVGDVTNVEGVVSSMSLSDLTPRHSNLYGERFQSSQLTLKVKRYSKPDVYFDREYDTMVAVEMPTVTYVHTQRFAQEVQNYFLHFAELQRLFARMKSSRKSRGDGDKMWMGMGTRVKLDVKAASPVILVPVASGRRQLLLVDLGGLSVSNGFKWTDTEEDGDDNGVKACLLDDMVVEFTNADLHLGEMAGSGKSRFKGETVVKVGGYKIVKFGPPLLREKCQLKVQVERNMMAHICKPVPDLSVKGTLSTLSIALNITQYKLLRFLLAYNMGECLDDVFAEDELPASYVTSSMGGLDSVWKTNCMTLDLVNVSVTLLSTDSLLGDESIACINFIKSSLSVESFCDKSQDIDLISQEIVITDTRFAEEPVDRRSNVFTNILQPLVIGGNANLAENFDVADDKVRVEVHHRRRHDKSNFTVLLNSMRLMAILDWWEIVRDFITCDYTFIATDEAADSFSSKFNKTDGRRKWEEAAAELAANTQMEIKLNVTDSEVVVLEDTSQWDSNAVIFKSTTVINFKPNSPKMLSCNLNRCEIFSCILGMEEETALSIVDPVTINCDLFAAAGDSKECTLSVHCQPLCIRLSYNDVQMFAKMLDSLPKQMRMGTEMMEVPGDSDVCGEVLKELLAMGFGAKDCSRALAQSDGNPDEAALWLIRKANDRTHLTPVPSPLFETNPAKIAGNEEKGMGTLFRAFQHMEFKTDCLSVCVIDDCQDSDVPFLEILTVDLTANKDLKQGAGWVKGTLSVHYYNRLLSGWEPVLEPWRCKLEWKPSGDDFRSKYVINVSADDILNVNVTKTFLDLYKTVKEVWTKDYYNAKGDDEKDNNKTGYKRRSPFVPFALKNDTGCPLSYSTLLSNDEEEFRAYTSSSRKASKLEHGNFHWKTVNVGDTVSFLYEERVIKHRHKNTHKIANHRLTVKVHGWKPVQPISLDRVGVYFRHALADDSYLESRDLPQARIVFDVTLEGSARKLVTVRSALLFKNQLQWPLEIKLENICALDRNSLTHTCIIAPGTREPVPLSHTHANICVRPLNPERSSQLFYSYSLPIFWQQKLARNPGDVLEESRECRSNKGSSYKFTAVVRRENYPADDPHSAWTHPGHEITFISPMLIENLLPHDLYYNVNDVENGVVQPGQFVSLHEVSNDMVTEMTFYLENYPGEGSIIIPPYAANFEQKLKLHDQDGRKLLLCVTVSIQRGSEIKVTIYAPYWIINKTALPLVFRQDGVVSETAGQYEEHEIARMVAPLLFSLSDPEASPAIVARLGTGIHRHVDGIPQWCQYFHLHVGVKVRRLHVSYRSNRSDSIYAIGINVRPGRGRFHNTKIVTLSAHYQIHNKSPYNLQFAQKYAAESAPMDPLATDTYVFTAPNGSVPFHWPRPEKEQRLCARIQDMPDCSWSGAFALVEDAFQFCICDKEGRMYFLRVEIVLQGATYFVIFADARNLPPPVRVDNYSRVSLGFCQKRKGGDSGERMCTARALSKVAYAWDEPGEARVLTLVAPGGVAADFDLQRLEAREQLTYENFIYVCFMATFEDEQEGRQLVLEVKPRTMQVILNRKEVGERAQFWRMTSQGQLQHEGSSPPSDPRKKKKSENDIWVLDIAKPAIQPNEFQPLTLSKPSSRRSSTQTWLFTKDGRLCCRHRNMCVQAKGGMAGLVAGTEAVLGPVDGGKSGKVTVKGVPVEQAISCQKLRAGSGILSVIVTTDGPTRVLEITDMKETKSTNMTSDCDFLHLDKVSRPRLESGVSRPRLESGKSQKYFSNLEVNVNLKHGIGVSLISAKPAEELLYAHLGHIVGCYNRAENGDEKVDVSAHEMQIDNQLVEAQSEVMLYVPPSSNAAAGNSKNFDLEENAPAVQVSYERCFSHYSFESKAEIFKALTVRVKNLCLTLEEILLLKLFAFAGYNSGSEEQQQLEMAEESDVETQQILTDVTSVHTKRYYFEILELVLGQVRLSVVTSSKLPLPLKSIKKKLGLTLLKFEDAAVDFKPFLRRHVFETSRFLFNSVVKHFRDELKWKAAIILGSVDFLGNPIGFVNDLKEGVGGLINDGNFGALVQNVTHGFSNSAVKVAETLSDGLGLITMDERHEEMRQKIRTAKSGKSSAHLKAGLKGFGFGLLGGVTSIIRQTYDGASNDGAKGFITGFGKGLVGTVTKPVVGILDFTSETAIALRDSSRSSNKVLLHRLRKPRCVVGPTGLLPVHSAEQSLGQEFLYAINGRNYDELFIAYAMLENVHIIVSSEIVRVFSIRDSNDAKHFDVKIEIPFCDLYECYPVSFSNSENHRSSGCIELAVRAEAAMNKSEVKKFIRVECRDEHLAAWISEQINYAKSTHVERQHTLFPPEDVSCA